MIRLSSPEPAGDTAVEEAPPTDEVRDHVVDTLRTDLGDGFVDALVKPGDDVWVRVTADAWREAGLVARDKLRCHFFNFLSAIDWLPSPFGKNEDSPLDERPEPSTEIATGYAGGETRFQLLARVTALGTGVGVTLKADLSEDDLAVDTWIPVYAGANWHEREMHEMYGIGFRGHPYLANIYLPGGFEGHPLRKDFPLLARQVKPWPGIVDVEPMPNEAEGDEDAEESEVTAEGEAPA
ncbi:MAG: nuoC [Acidimicrobiales bacterium]|nr:nuoC [Acidimicrobiales bacterium]